MYYPAPTTTMLFHSEMNSERQSVAKSEFAEPGKDQPIRPRPQSIISDSKTNRNYRDISDRDSKFSEDRNPSLSLNPSIELSGSLFAS